jgi:hypothetical protein
MEHAINRATWMPSCPGAGYSLHQEQDAADRLPSRPRGARGAVIGQLVEFVVVGGEGFALTGVVVQVLHNGW